MLLNNILQMIKLTRAHIGIAVLPSFFIGTLFAVIRGYSFNSFLFIFGFIIIFLVYAAASYINDFYDYEADKYNRQFGFSGGSGVLQKYPQLREYTKWAALVFIIVAITGAIILGIFTFLPLWSTLLIMIGAGFSWFYSAPPIKLSYRGFSEIPHFVAGMLNTIWGYIIVTGFIDLEVIIFAVPLALQLLNVILIFEIPDREADIHGGKKNIIVSHGRLVSFTIISGIFWVVSFLYFLYAVFGWLGNVLNFWLFMGVSMIPTVFSSLVLIKKPVEQKIATFFAIRIALSLFFVLIVFLGYSLYLVI